ncbi:MAG: hypothetical protein Ct9H90mP20_5340 [Candidatus Neomarinimicrobiota bacterium]|nr:MAG: hypothetical protein Ct9H90mP20_5340 [Candidatus Neomarinimicrobiota bacterium]
MRIMFIHLCPDATDGIIKGLYRFIQKLTQNILFGSGPLMGEVIEANKF